MREGRRAAPQVALTEVRPQERVSVGESWSGVQWGILYREGAQVGHKAGSHQHIAKNVVKHVLQILHSLLPANLFVC